MTEAAAAPSDLLQQPGTAPAAADPAKQIVKAVIHFGPGITPPEGVTAVSNADVMRERTAETFRSLGVDEAVLAQRGQPVSEMEYRLAEHKKASLFQDKGWVQKYLSGDQEARRTLGTLSIILGSPVTKEDGNV